MPQKRIAHILKVIHIKPIIHPLISLFKNDYLILHLDYVSPHNLSDEVYSIAQIDFAEIYKVVPSFVKFYRLPHCLNVQVVPYEKVFI